MEAWLVRCVPREEPAWVRVYGPNWHSRKTSANDSERGSRTANESPSVESNSDFPTCAHLTESDPMSHTSSPAPGWSELADSAGLDLLARIAAEVDAGRTIESIGQTLRKDGYEPGIIAAALTQTDLRSKAQQKFGSHASELLFTRAGLEQASRARVSELHAARFHAAGCTTVADLGCGLGAESLAFLQAGLDVRAVEIDPLTAAYARHNLATVAARPEYGSATVTLADAESVDLAGIDGIFLDPARRTAGHRDTRRVSPDDYSPSLDFAFHAARSASAGGVKLGPGLPRELLPEDAESQWVSVDGALVETSIWFGQAARHGIHRAATLLQGNETHELTGSADADDAAVRELGNYVYEPDGAVIRARLIGTLAAQLNAGMVREGIAYLTGDEFVPTPFAQAFRIVDELPAGEKQLRKELSARDIGTLEIKKRGIDVDPASLRKRLKLRGSQSATIILTRVADRHVALLAERVR